MGGGRLLRCGVLNIDPSARAKETRLHASCGCELRVALFPLYLNVARPLLWPSASFTPGWLNVPLGGGGGGGGGGLKMSAELRKWGLGTAAKV